MYPQRANRTLVLAALMLMGWGVAPLWSFIPLERDRQLAFPDTPAGRCAADFFEAFNSGNDDSMRHFEKQHRAESALEARSIDQRIEQYHELLGEWGTLRPLRILGGSEREISVLVLASRANEAWSTRFQLEDEPPHGLIAVAISGPVDPALAGTFARDIDETTCHETVKAVARLLKEGYVYPEVGSKMADALLRAATEGRYDGLSSAGELAGRITEDLRNICHDHHLNVIPAGASNVPSVCGSDAGPGEEDGNDYGFRKVEVLPGNIGYIKFDMFHDSKQAQEVAASALARVAGCRALIFDLRNNGGGSPEMIRFISSYLFDKPTHLNTFYDRLSKKTSETWTLADIPGKRFTTDLPVYVLTSGYTGSAAEEFTYNLKHLQRATIVGETTVGAAHPVTTRVVNDYFQLVLPYARAENPVTRTNWEGVGVIPHIKVPAAKALDAAVEDATKQIKFGQASPAS